MIILNIKYTMKKIIVFFICFIVLIFSYPEKENISTDIVKEEVKEKVQKVNIDYKGETVSLDLEDYVIGVVACEMGASFDIEALKAMSVAARTFALYKIKTNKNYKLKTTTKDQCYITNKQMKKRWGKNYDKYYNKIKKAVDETKNEYLTYNNKVIIAFYFSISNGKTENCEDVFSQKLDYLVSVDSKWDKEYSYKKKTIKYNESNFLSKLGIKSDSVNDIKIDRGKTGRIRYIRINNKKFKGTKIRQLLSLRSTDFDIKVENGIVYITTRGYGHGVGMSQYGANGMAKEGYKYDEILKHYYKGVEISV